VSGRFLGRDPMLATDRDQDRHPVRVGTTSSDAGPGRPGLAQRDLGRHARPV